MKLNAKYITHKLKDDKVIIGFQVDVNFLNSIAFLKEGQEYQLEMLKPKSNKSIQQNNYLWSLLREICMVQDGDTRDLNDLYLQMLEQSGAKCFEITILKEAYDEFRKTIRHCKIVSEFVDNDKKEYYTIICFPGVSQFNTRDISKLLDYVIRYASAMGIDTTIYER